MTPRHFVKQRQVVAICTYVLYIILGLLTSARLSELSFYDWAEMDHVVSFSAACLCRNGDVDFQCEMVIGTATQSYKSIVE